MGVETLTPKCAGPSVADLMGVRRAAGWWGWPHAGPLVAAAVAVAACEATPMCRAKRRLRPLTARSLRIDRGGFDIRLQADQMEESFDEHA